MRTLSTSTTLVDPYRAGLAMGLELAAIQPEVVFLFCTAHYAKWDELLEGLYDGLDDASVQLIGATGDGFLERSHVADLGACALGLNSAGALRWHVAASTGVQQDPGGAVRDTLGVLQAALQGRAPAAYFLFSDFHTDASVLESVLRDEVQVPVMGGLAADDNSKMEQCGVFCNRQHYADAVVMLACEGPLSFQVHIGNSIAPVGSAGCVAGAVGKTLQKIDGIDATEFIERETGKPFLHTDQGSIALTVAHTGFAGEKCLRALVENYRANDGSLTLHGGIGDGEMVQVCLASPSQLRDEVYKIAQTVQSSGMAPSAALIISCAGRKSLLGGKIDFEVEAIRDACAQPFPMVGFSSFGEIGPLRHQGRYTRNLFHNMTYVLVLLGQCDG